MATLRLRPVTGIRGDSWVSNPRRIRDTRVRRGRCNCGGVPGRASGPMTTGICDHVVAGCHRAMGCVSQGGVGGISAIRHVCEQMRSHARSLNLLARGPFNTPGCEISPTTVLRTAALQLNRTRSLAAYGAAKLMVEPLAQPQPPEGMGVVR